MSRTSCMPHCRWLGPAFAALLIACSSSDPQAPSGPAPADASLEEASNGDADAAPAEASDEDGSSGNDGSSEDGPASDTGADAAPDGAACTLAAPYSSSNPTCNDCAQSECCAEVNGCLLDPACNDDFVNCMLACTLDADAGTIQPCIDDCGVQYPQGMAEWDTLVACVDGKCLTECE